jgi:hypothetical protein
MFFIIIIWTHTHMEHSDQDREHSDAAVMEYQ